MNVGVSKDIKNKNAVIKPYFFSSQTFHRFKTMYDVKSNNTVVMVNLDRATVYESKDFAEYVNKLIDEGNTKLIIDLENVYFVDSIFFGTMVSLLKRVNKQNGYIKIILNSDNRPELIAMPTFNGIFKIYPNLFEAIKSSK